QIHTHTHLLQAPDVHTHGTKSTHMQLHTHTHTQRTHTHDHHQHTQPHTHTRALHGTPPTRPHNTHNTHTHLVFTPTDLFMTDKHITNKIFHIVSLLGSQCMHLHLLRNVLQSPGGHEIG